MAKKKESEEDDKAQRLYKSHDSIMNGLDWNLENDLNMSWTELAATKEYHEISSAIYRLVHGLYTLEADDE